MEHFLVVSILKRAAKGNIKDVRTHLFHKEKGIVVEWLNIAQQYDYLIKLKV